MSFMSDTTSAIKSRFGFQEHASDSVTSRNSPDLLKSACKDNQAQIMEVRRIMELNDEDGVIGGTGSSSHSFEFHEDPSFWKDHNVQVIIRTRPLSSNEISLQGYSKCIRQESCKTITWTGPPESRFTFDLVADEYVSQEKLFKVAGLPMVENCIGGYNSCMFAYGQTGSGKTHTMLGDIEGGTRRHSVNCGMTPRVFECLFSRIQKEKEARRDEKLRFTCKCSFLEIYNEQILDLLDPISNNLQIREDIKKGVYVENLKEIEVGSARDVIQQLLQGATNRKVASTNMNLASSRSHSVFTCIIESKWESQGVTHHRFSRLNLVDLAGSERQKSSGAEGERLKEATNINKSLSTLGLVIMNLVNISNGKSLHVPYRDSKLTFLLQDSLGGNSKTTIIANISPSSCCSLETLSTLKFAQRAKYIKNNAIVNEDASGDVIAMRLQIQQLKKEVSHLRGLVNGGTNHQGTDTLAATFSGSTGSINWEGLQGSFSSLTTGKRMSQRKDYEVALVGAFKREKEKDIALQALVAENQAAMQLAKQREDEIQGLKMRLRFREARIKSLESVVSREISAETHLLKEKEEHLKEIEVLRTQVDRSQEVTRFAMENLCLKEEIRRLKSFYEEGERESTIEQIAVLQNKLLEALDWKLMHESDTPTVQEENSNTMPEFRGNDNLLISKVESSPLQSSINEENEFLRMQAIHNQSELDTLQKNLELCFVEKQKLERHVNDLVAELEAERSSRDTKGRQLELPSSSTDMSLFNFSDQLELKTMVDAIASASQREAEAHETAINLSKENDDLRMKLKVLIEDNNKLIELYEKAAEDCNYRNLAKADSTPDAAEVVEVPNEKETVIKQVVEDLEHQLVEMHEENDKLMGLYEKAMQEKDELKKLLSSLEQKQVETRGDFDCIEKLVEVDGGERNECTEGTFDVPRLNVQNGSSLFPEDSPDNEEKIYDDTNRVMESDVQTDTEPSAVIVERLHEDLNLIRMKLEKTDELLSTSAETVTVFGSVEKMIFEADKLTRDIEAKENEIQVKKHQLESLKVNWSEMQEKRDLVQKKLSALKYSLSSFSSSLVYFEQREAKARARAQASKSYLDQKKNELTTLQASRDEIESSRKKVQQSEVETRNNLLYLTSKFEEEKRKQESDKVLFAIENVENVDPTQKNWQLGGKAMELLKAEEEKTKLQSEIKLAREKLEVVKREIENLTKKSSNIDCELQDVQMEIQKASKLFEEMSFALEGVIQEKETLLEMKEKGEDEIDGMIVEYQQSLFETDLKEEEKKMIEEELEMEFRRKEELIVARIMISQKTSELMEARYGSSLLSEKMEEELKRVQSSVLEAKILLEEGKLKS